MHDLVCYLGICITGASSAQVCELNTTCHTTADALTASTCMCQPGYAARNPCALKGNAIAVTVQ